jgi:hypothetical protein
LPAPMQELQPIPFDRLDAVIRKLAKRGGK